LSFPKTFSLTVEAAVTNSFTWAAPTASGQVINIPGNTINDVWTSFEIRDEFGLIGAQPSVPKGLYRDSGIAYTNEVGDEGSVWAHAGGHNDYAGNETYKWDCATATWSQWKAPHSPVYRTTDANFDSESTRGFFIDTPVAPVTRVAPTSPPQVKDPDREYSVSSYDGTWGDYVGQPGATHSFSHALVIPAGELSTGPCLFRKSASLGWSNSRQAEQPFHWTDLGSAANPWVHMGGVTTVTTYLNGSCYWNGKVYSFGSTNSDRLVDVIDLTTKAGTTWTWGSTSADNFKNGAGFVTQVTDSTVPYFVFVSGDYSTEKDNSITTPAIRLIRCPDGQANEGVLTKPAMTGVAFPADKGRYYSVCWAQAKRALYFVPWAATNVIYKAAPVSSFTGDWVVTTETLSGQTLLLPDTGAQMKPRTFFVNGCLVTFSSTNAPVQAIGVA
jgi:hypothetical protein